MAEWALLGKGTLNLSRNDSVDICVTVPVNVVVLTAVLQCFVHTRTPWATLLLTAIASSERVLFIHRD